MSKKKTNKPGYGVNPHRAKKVRQPTRCPVCGAPIRMIPLAQMSFGDAPLPGSPEYFWVCSNYPCCNTYIKADERTKQPDGTLAGAKLRHKRIMVHKWSSLLVSLGLYTPDTFRAMCGFYLGVPNADEVHVRYMTEGECNTILAQCTKMAEANPKIMDAIQEGTTIWRDMHGITVSHKVWQEEVIKKASTKSEH